MHTAGFGRKSHAAILLNLALAICATFQGLWHLKKLKDSARCFTEASLAVEPDFWISPPATSIIRAKLLVVKRQSQKRQ
jgi:hypothetical protein